MLNPTTRKILLGVAGLGLFSTLAACTQPQATNEAPTTPDTTTAPDATTPGTAPTAEAPATDAPTTAQGASTETVAGVIDENDSFSILKEAIDEAELGATLNQAGPYTIFAPTNAAFQSLPPETLQALQQPENRDKLKQILTYHVVQGAVPSSDITPGEVPTLSGQTVNLATSGSEVTVNGATVSQPDIIASNGVVHAIDQVLLPPDLQLQ